MSEVNKRGYDGSGRQERARQAQRSVLAAARELLEDKGYGATTIAAVARLAGVSAENIYKTYGTKAALTKAVFDVAIAGDDEPVAVRDRPEVRALTAAPDVCTMIQMYARQAAVRQQRSARIQLAIRDGRSGDEALSRLWQTVLEERLAGMTMFGRHLLGSGGLRSGIDLDEVRDVLWTYVAVEFYDLLVLERGWAIDRYAEWLGRAMVNALI